MSPQPAAIAHYRITSKLGEGGMGAVYRATDTKLNREVAIKMLPAALAGDAQYLARFEREAQVLASLNHPNIATVYGIEDGALVMELVEGPDLRGPLPVDEVIVIARQIAQGLEAAHEKGIIHRDLKPGNIKVASSGVVKILDFGLAKSVAGENSTAAPANPTISPTLSLEMTQAGMILGTAAYMSPEQARGKPVDKRADIWAFGVVLYELLTGKMLFGGGESVTDTLAAVMKDEPDLKALPAATPPHIHRLLGRCLRKDAATRLRDIGEARVALDEPDEVQLAATSTRTPLLWITVAGIAVLAAGASWLRPKPAEPNAAAAHFVLPLPAGTNNPRAGAAPNAVPSPDGRLLAFVAAENGTNHLWIRAMNSVSAHRIEQTEGASLPFWSPDGQFVAFFADQKVKKVGISGGAPQTVCEMKGSTSRSGGDGGTWNREGVILFASSGRSPLMRVSATGGPDTPVTSLEQTGDLSHHFPQFLPDGRHFLYFAASVDPSQSAVYIQELGSSHRVLVLRSMTRAVWTPPGYLLFARDQTLFAQRLNPKTFQLEGEAQSVAEDVGYNASNGRASFAVSETGVLVYRGGFRSTEMQVSWLDRQGNLIGKVGKPGPYWNMALAPDEKSVALVMGTGNKHDVWIMDLAGGMLTRATHDQQASVFQLGAWSPDSRRIVMNRFNASPLELVVASGKTTVLDAANLQVETWSPDGGTLLGIDARSRSPILTLRAGGGGRPQELPDSPAGVRELVLSPDGNFVAYGSAEGGPSEITVASFPTFAERRQVSSGGGQHPVWRKDGKELFFEKSTSGSAWSVSIQTGGSKIEAGIAKELFSYPARRGSYGGFAVSGDGQRLLALVPVNQAPPAAQVMIVVNWTADLKK